MKILIAGSGQVGEMLIKQLSSEGYDLTVIDSDPLVLEKLVDRYDVMAVRGNCASLETMRQAGGEHADLMIAATGSDEINLLCSMTVHGLNPKIHTIARIRNPEYTEQAYSMRDVFGLSLAFNPERQAATEIDRLLKFPAFLKRESFAKGRVEIVEIRIDADSKLKDVPLSILYKIVKCRVLVCAVLRDGSAVTPDGNFTLREGDKIFVTAPTHSLSLLLKNLGIVTHKARRVMIVGGGTVSYYLTEELRDDRAEVTIIEKNRDKCLKLAALLPDANIIHGDAGSRSLVESEGLSDCDALITLTGTDELNVIVSMYGNSCGVPRIITKLDRLEDAKIIDSLPLGSIVSPKRLCCNTIVRYVRAMQNQTGAAIAIHSIAEGQAEAMEFVVDESAHHCGKPLKQLKLKKNILIVCITHRGKIEIPGGDSMFSKGDSIVIVSSGGEIIHQLNDIFA
ncbi:MAG: Trk system potassium transporter TrkA [Clostridia bacterium]|nr:Trk system potassium transporter TrkA [Clostridia bacterium]